VSLIAPTFAGKASTVATFSLVAVSANAVAVIVRKTGAFETSAWKITHDCRNYKTNKTFEFYSKCFKGFIRAFPYQQLGRPPS